MMLQTVVLALFGGGATIVLGTIVVVTLAIMAGAYISENGGSR
jgi:ABC-type phosphate transport system permease subunit